MSTSKRTARPSLSTPASSASKASCRSARARPTARGPLHIGSKARTGLASSQARSGRGLGALVAPGRFNAIPSRLETCVPWSGLDAIPQDGRRISSRVRTRTRPAVRREAEEDWGRLGGPRRQGHVDEPCVCTPTVQLDFVRQEKASRSSGDPQSRVGTPKTSFACDLHHTNTENFRRTLFPSPTEERRRGQAFPKTWATKHDPETIERRPRQAWPHASWLRPHRRCGRPSGAPLGGRR